MRRGIKAGLVLSSFLLVTGGVVGYAVWKTTDQKSQPKAVKSSSITQSSATPLSTEKNSAGALNVTGNSGLGGGIESAEPKQQLNESEQKIPGPETFGQFDKYKEEKNALFSDLHVGDGEEIKVNKKAAVIYKVYLTNGTLVDQNRLDKENKITPFVFTYGGHEVIVGWEQAIGGMKVHGVRRMIIPPSVGYGAQGKDPVPANAVLVIDVQLLEVEK